MPAERSNLAFRMSAIYVIFGLLWILVSDVIVEALASPDALTTFQTFKGSIFVMASAMLMFMVITREISARNRAEQQTRLIESAIEQIHEGVIITGPDIDGDGPVTEYVNPAIARITGYSREELLGQTLQLLVDERTDINMMTRYMEEMRDGRTATGETINYRKDGSKYFSEWQSVPLHDNQGRISHFVSIHRDITSNHEAKVKLSESEQRFRSLYDLNPDGVFALDLEGKVTMINAVARDMIDSPVSNVVGTRYRDLVASDAEEAASIRFDRVVHGEALQYDTHFFKQSGDKVEIEGIAIPIVIDGDVTGVFCVMKDVTRRNAGERQLRTQLRRAAALYEIDRAITTGSDRQKTLQIILAQIVQLLEVDAGAIAVLDPDAQEVCYEAMIGFDPPSGISLRLPVGFDQLKTLAFSSQVRTIPDIREDPDAAIHPELLSGQAFVSYTSAPLVAKGRVQGVLEVFHRSGEPHDLEWFDMLQSLVTQAAIAIDNASLFDDLKRSNADLSAAYDTTLAGWARALEMRDDETQGHSERVTSGTLELAEALGIKGDDLANVRRGALLHDIGKMAIPDSILSKPGPLTSDEWTVMRMHPVFARDMLQDIPFLRPAIDIPYYHHERWDGTGYPEGLEGTEIPLTARIFAVVDVWDALLSDRPYRKAWTEGDVREHIQRGANEHFDPDVVNVFLSRIQAPLK